MQTMRVVFYDAHCRFCNFWVRQAIKRDRNAVLRFAPLEGKTARDLLMHHANKPGTEETVAFYDDGKIFTAAGAILQICKYLRGGAACRGLLLGLPPFLRNALYMQVARKRFVWHKREKECLLPPAEIVSKFLD